MAKNLEVSFLLDFYGEMLTQKQHDFLVYYYDEDLSLSEIAENEGITRLKKGLEEIEQCAEAINAYNLSHTLSREINDNVARIKALTAYLCE